jgi:anti-sigma factor RsiW
MSHTDDGTLHAYLDGELSAREAVELEQHVAACPDCRARLDEARALIKRAGNLLALAAPAQGALPPWPVAAPRRSGRGGVPLAWAATVVLALGAAWYVGRRTLMLERSAPAPALARRQATPLAAAPPAAPSPAPSRVAVASTTAAVSGPGAGRPTADTASAAVVVAQRAAERRAEPGPWVELGFEAAGALLGQPPLAIPGLSIRRLARPRTGSAVLLVEQLVDSQTVVRLYEQRRAAGPPDSLLQDVLAAGGAAAARVGRDVGPVRVEIEGPLAPDSLRRLLERVK